MKITGELLKTERLKRNLSVADVASSLKLSSRIILSIEAGDVEELPAKTFIRGFVKSYAQLLKLDSDLILRQFLEEMGSTQPLPKVPPPQSTTSDNKPHKTKSEPVVATHLDINQDSKKKTILYISIAVVLLAFILIINNVVDKYQKESEIDKLVVPQVQPLPPTENSSVPTITPGIGASAGAPIDPLAAAAGITAGKPTVETVSGSELSTSDIGPSTAPPNEFEPSSEKPVELIIEAKKDIEFFYAKGNTKNFVRVKLSPKEIQVIRSPAGLHLKAGDGSALYLILNGVEKGLAASAGKPIRLTF